MDYSKIWADNGDVSQPTDEQILAGFGFLGSAPPSAELFNWIMQDIALKLQSLYSTSRQWKALTAYSVGDIVYSPDASSFKRMECTVSGTSGATEPTWTDAGTTVADGTVTWKVVDIKNFLSLAGGTMAGAIAMASNKVTGLADGTASGDAVHYGQFNMSLATAGYQKFPSGYILQWGNGTTNASGVFTTSLPMTFPTAQLGGIACNYGASSPVVAAVSNLSATSITVNSFYSTTGAGIATQICWFVWGK